LKTKIIISRKTILSSIGENCTLNAHSRFGPSSNSTPCSPGTVCSVGTCQSLFSRTENQSCNGDFQCQSSLTCTEFQANSTGTCVKSFDLSPVKCTSNSTCNQLPDGMCICSAFSGTQYCFSRYYNLCFQELQDYYRCLWQHQCPFLSNPFLPNRLSRSCSEQNCKHESKDLLDCYCPSFQMEKGNCVFYGVCPKTQKPPSRFPVAAVVVPVILAVFLLGGILYCIHRRRSQYEMVA